jgi:transposase-like protein
MTFIKRTFGIAVVRAPHLKKNLAWKMSLTENVGTYQELRWQLWTRGFEIEAVVVDGKPGLFKVFGDVPTQMCHFHQIQIITRYLTARPKLIAGKTLRQIALRLPKSNEDEIKKLLDGWHNEWKDFLKEKTFNPETNRWSYTHRRLRSAFRSINKNLPLLYTYQKYPELKIPNTTNSLDGTFSHLKDMLRIHRGLKKNRKLKLIDEFLSK